MQLVAFSSRGTAVDDGLGFERLLTSVSTRLASLEREQLAPALDYALEQVCLAMNADRSTIIEFNENGTIHRRTHGSDPGSRIRPSTSSRRAGDGFRAGF